MEEEYGKFRREYLMGMKDIAPTYWDYVNLLNKNIDGKNLDYYVSMSLKELLV